MKKYKANLEQAPYRNPLEQLILRADAVDILEKIRPTVALCSRTLFALIKSKFDQSMIAALISSWPSIAPILIWMIRNQLLPQEGIDFLYQKATPAIIKNHFDVYHAFFEKYNFTSCPTDVRTSYLTHHVAQKGKFQVKQLNLLYCKNKSPFDIGLLYDDLLCIPGQTPETVLATICELHKINQYPP